MTDSHIHYGHCSLTGLVHDEHAIVKLIKRFKLEALAVFPYDQAVSASNEAILRISRHHKEIKPFMRFTLLSHETEQQLRERFDLFVGAKIHPSLDKCSILNYGTVYEKCSQEGKPIIVHCGRWKEVASYELAIQVAKQYPKLKLILAHMGGNELSNTKGAIQAAAQLSNVYLETSNCRIALMIEEAAKELGDRLLFGSDSNWGNIPANLAMVMEAKLTQKQRRMILRDNFLRIMGA